MFLLTEEACAGLWVSFFPFDPQKINDTGTAETRRKVEKLLAVSCVIYSKVDLKGKKKTSPQYIEYLLCCSTWNRFHLDT